MPTSFKINLTGKIGPVELINYTNKCRCREVMLSQIKEAVADRVFLKITQSQHCSAWHRVIYIVSPAKLLMYVFQNDIHDIEMSVECYDDRVRQQLLHIAPEIIDRYNSKVEITDLTVKDPFSNQSTTYIVARSDGPEAIAAIWWSILFGRLVFYAFSHDNRKRFYSNPRHIISKSSRYSGDCWYNPDDLNHHLQVWDNGTNEVSVGKWLIYGSGPCMFRNGIQVGRDDDQYIKVAEMYKIRDCILSLY